MEPKNNLKWYIVILLALAGAFCVAAPNMALSVLFEEISADLDLNLVQVGIVWGFGSLFSMISGVVSGALGDSIGPKRVILIGIVTMSLAGAARGLTHTFPTMLMAVSLFGFSVPMVTISAYKLTGMWFPKEQLGFANGIFGTGMSLGFFTGAMFSATVLSPWLGGWRNVLFFYGGVSLLVFIFWLFSPSHPSQANASDQGPKISMRQAYAHTIKFKDLWLIGLGLLGVGGCLQGIYGYLPLFLRSQGWEVVSADGALSLLHGLGILFTIPLTLASDRFGIRKQMVGIMMVMLIVGTLLLPTASHTWVWIAVFFIGIVRDTTLTLLITMVFDVERIGPLYAGTANGLVFVMLTFGNFISPPIGNKLATYGPGLPFIFWAGLAFIALAAFYFLRKSLVPAVQSEPAIAK